MEDLLQDGIFWSHLWSLLWPKQSHHLLLSPSPFAFPRQPNCCGCANSSGAAAWPASERNYSTSYRKCSHEKTHGLGQGAAMKGTLGNWAWMFSSAQVSTKVSKTLLFEKICKGECASFIVSSNKQNIKCIFNALNLLKDFLNLAHWNIIEIVLLSATSLVSNHIIKQSQIAKLVCLVPTPQK